MPVRRDLLFASLAAAPGGAATRRDLFAFARLHARVGREAEVAAAIADVHGPTLEEAGCLGHNGFRSIRDARLFYIFSRWRDEAAFEAHAEFPHTLRFLARVEPAIDHALEVARTVRIV